MICDELRIPGNSLGYPLYCNSSSPSLFKFTTLMDQRFQKQRTVVLLGDKNVGKTSLIKALEQIGKATPIAGPSDIHEVTYKGTKLLMVDVAGDSMKSITPNTIRYARVVLLTYDITNHETLDNCKYWHQFAEGNRKEDPVAYALVGCKSDLSNDRQVSWDSADRVCNMLNAKKLFEVSTTKTASCNNLMDWVHGIMKEVAVQDDAVNDGSVALGNPPQPQNNQTEGSICSRC